MTKCKKRSMMLPEIESVWCKQLRRAFKAQWLAGSGVQLPGNRIQLFLRETIQVTPLGQVLPQQTIGVLVDAALPGAVWIGKIDLHPCGFCQSLMCRHFPALIVRQREALLSINAAEHMTEVGQRRLSRRIFHFGRYCEQRGPLHQRTDR